VVRRHAPDKLVTVGVSVPHVDLVRNLDTDYRAVHFYPWMAGIRDAGPDMIGDLEACLAQLPKTQPFLLEEFPGVGPVGEYLTRARAAGAAGALIWNLRPGIDDQTQAWAKEEEKLQAMRSFVDSLTTKARSPGLFYCRKTGCAGHASPRERCAYLCPKDGCPGHAQPSHRCAYYCDRSGCGGHSAAHHRCW